jgi:dihydropyrimidinase
LDLGLEGGARYVVNAKGAVVLPGVIDMHTHLRSPKGEKDLFTGETTSAVAGGVTTVGDFTYPAGTRFELEFEEKRGRLERESLCDFTLHTVVQTLEQVDEARTLTVKVFFSASGLGAKAGGGLALLQRAVGKGHQVLAHVEALEDYLAICQSDFSSAGLGGVHILHVPHQRYVSAVQAAEEECITLETCPHYLLWEWVRDSEGCDVNPPVELCDLWPEVRAGRISTIGTDHCSYTWQEKEELGLPGFPGLETLLPLIFTFGLEAGHISWLDLTRLLSAGPACVLGLYPRKGALQIGADADIVLFDPECKYTIQEPGYGRGDFTPFAGLEARGRVLRTYVRGREVYSNGVADLNAAGWGKWQDCFQDAAQVADRDRS